MEREIKFKAKNLVNGKWIEGDLLHGIRGNVMIRDTGFIAHDVDPSTVCQYTGLKDCKGQDIWEHDLLELQGSYEYKYSETIFEVFWNPEIASFVLGYLKSKGNYPSKTLGKSISCFPLAVISNRFDKEEGK